MPSLYDDYADEDLGAAIKGKHPGKFDDIDHAELGRAAKRQFTYTGPPHPAPAQPKTPVKAGSVATTPEKPNTIKIQLDQLKQGIRKVVMFPRRTPVPYSARQFHANRMDTAIGTFFFNPHMITSHQIREAIAADQLPLILGDAQIGYGAPSKQDLTPPVAAVVSRDARGIPVQDVATDQKHIEQTKIASRAVTPPGGTVATESPDSVIDERLSSGVPTTDIPSGIPSFNPRMKFRKARRLGILG